MYKIDPQDLTITTYVSKVAGNYSYNAKSGVKVCHEPTQLEVSIDKRRSQYGNQGLCIKILQDLLTDFKEGDIVVTQYGIGEITTSSEEDCCFAVEDGTGRYSRFEEIAHTEEGFAYKKEQALRKGLESLEQEFQDKRKKLIDNWG